MIGKVSALPTLLSSPTLAPYFHPLFKNFSDPPSRGGNQNLLPSL